MAAGLVNEAARVRTALLFILLGLVVQAFCIYDVTPGTFVLLALVAAPLLSIGMLIFVLTILRVRREARGTRTEELEV